MAKGKGKVKFKPGALQALRSTPEARAYLQAEGKAYQERCGGEDKGYLLTELVVEESRTAVSLMATGKARNSNRIHHTLIRKL